MDYSVSSTHTGDSQEGSEEADFVELTRRGSSVPKLLLRKSGSVSRGEGEGTARLPALFLENPRNLRLERAVRVRTEPPVRDMEPFVKIEDEKSERMAQFRDALFSLGKNFHGIAEEVSFLRAGGAVAALRYYYDKYKPWAARMKRMASEGLELEFRVPLIRETMAMFDFTKDSCMKCGELGELVCCDTCDLAIHAKCASPPITNVEADYVCATCARRYPSDDQSRHRHFMRAELEFMAAQREELEALMTKAHATRVASSV